MSEYNTEMLILARQAAGHSQSSLANAVGVTQGRISKIESGLLEAQQDLLDALAAELGVRTSFFARNDRRHGLPVSFYRKRKTLGKKAISSMEAKFSIVMDDLARLFRAVEIEHDYETPKLDPDEYNGNVEEIARVIRAYWRIPSGPILNLIEVLESADIVVIPIGDLPRKFDAIAYPRAVADAPHVIFIQPAVPMDRLRFTLAHELGHLVMHTRLPSDEMESEAHRFAAEFLMPSSEIGPHLNRITLAKLARLKLQWRTSMASLAYRARSLGNLTDSQYRYVCMQLSKHGYRKKEPVEIPREEPSLLDEIIDMYLHELGYSADQLAALVDLSPSAFEARYRRPTGLRVVR